MSNNRFFTNQLLELFQIYNKTLDNNIPALTLSAKTYLNTSLLNAFFIIKQAEKYPYIHQQTHEWVGHNTQLSEVLPDLALFEWMLLKTP